MVSRKLVKAVVMRYYSASSVNASRSYKTISIGRDQMDSRTRSFFSRYRDIFQSHRDLWLKGGPARDVLIQSLKSGGLSRSLGYHHIPSYSDARDFDLVLIGSDNRTARRLEEEFSKDIDGYIELSPSIRSYMGSRDININEALLRPDELVFSKRALNAIQKDMLGVSSFEYDRSWSYPVPPKVALKLVLLSVREGIPYDSYDARSIVHASPFLLLVFLFKAYETGKEESFFKELKKNGGPDSEKYDGPDGYLFHLLDEVDNFKLSPSQRRIYDSVKKERERDLSHVESSMRLPFLQTWTF